MRFFIIFLIFQKIGFLAYLIAPEVPGPLKSNSASKNIPGDLSTASDHEIYLFIIIENIFLYFSFKNKYVYQTKY